MKLVSWFSSRRSFPHPSPLPEGEGTRAEDFGSRSTKLDTLSAFTLAESLIAMSIVSFTLITILGLLPSGMESMKQSEERAARARIMATLVSEYEAMDWEALNRLAGSEQGPFFFDRNGIRLSASTTQEKVYAAKTRVSAENDRRTQIGGGNSTNKYLRVLEITVSSRATEGNPFSENQPDALDRRAIMLGDTGSRVGELMP
jgi:uncharacterized protein (TIGR02598 family)